MGRIPTRTTRTQGRGMNAVDRCRCTPYFQDAGGGYTEYVPEWEPSCPEHGEIDEILAAGQYVDRSGRMWKIVRSPLIGIWWGTPHAEASKLVLHENKMRLLIERDQHRIECVGLHDCYVHPTPRILFHDGLWSVVAPGLQAWQDSRHIEFADAWDAARALAARS